MTFYVNKGSNHNLIITFDYSPERVKKIKQITNRWNPVEKYWEIADTEQCIRRFLNVFQDEEIIFDLKRVEKLPDILSKDEVIRLFKQVMNVKHRAILMLTYSAGLRVSEVVSLKVMDIDSNRMLIHVRQGKGRKDR